MKINIIIPSTVLGGGLRVVFTYANYLVDNGHDVIAYLPAIYKWRDIDKVNIKTTIANSFLRRNKITWFSPRFFIRVVPIISNSFIRDADVTIATAWFTARNVYELSEKKGKKVYFIQDYEIWNQNKNIVDATYMLDMHRIVITNTLKNTLLQECGVDSEVVYNGHASNEFFNGIKEVHTPRNLIMLGNFSEHKGGEIGLRIMKQLHDKYGVKGIIFSAHPREDIPDFIEFYHQPPRDLLMSLYQKSDICLFPSKQEAWGLTAIEAMANKVAVVGFNTGCLSEIGENNVNALVVDVNDEDGFVNAVEMLIEDDRQLRRIQENGYNTVKELTWAKSGAKFEELLINALRH